MTKADRLCLKLALWPIAIYALTLVTFMVVRSLNGFGPLPDGSANYVPAATLFVTLGAIITANLLRFRFARLSGDPQGCVRPPLAIPLQGETQTAQKHGVSAPL